MQAKRENVPQGNGMHMQYQQAKREKVPLQREIHPSFFLEE